MRIVTFSFASAAILFLFRGQWSLRVDFDFMLQQFSWGDFLVAMALFAVVWYAVLALVCYRSELFGLLGGANGIRAGTPVKVAGLGEKQPARESTGDQASLMGASRLPEGVQVLGSEELMFSGSGGQGRYDQVGLIADVLQELKTVFSELERKAGDKRDFFSMLARVKEEYGPLLGHPSLAALTGFVQEHAPFHLEPEELERLWY